jgi:hypothetical protein
MGKSMNGFREREKAFEAKYLHDEELHFRIKVRRNHLFGLWVAGLLGYNGKEADQYVEEIILIDVQKTHEDDILHKVLRDLQKAKISVSEHRLRKELEKCWEAARKMIMNNKEL